MARYVPMSNPTLSWASLHITSFLRKTCNGSPNRKSNGWGEESFESKGSERPSIHMPRPAYSYPLPTNAIISHQRGPFTPTPGIPHHNPLCTKTKPMKGLWSEHKAPWLSTLRGRGKHPARQLLCDRLQDTKLAWLIDAIFYYIPHSRRAGQANKVAIKNNSVPMICDEKKG